MARTIIRNHELPFSASFFRKVTVEKVDIIGWMDLTKFGVLTQKDINRVGAWADKLISKNVTGPLA